MKPTEILPRGGELDLDRLLNPARFFGHPRDVVADATLTLIEKRAILSSWASDACAVTSMPALRNPIGAAAPVSFDDIMDALKELDEMDENPPRKSLWRRHSRPVRRQHPGEGATS